MLFDHKKPLLFLDGKGKVGIVDYQIKLEEQIGLKYESIRLVPTPACAFVFPYPMLSGVVSTF